jgi:hypothetical protein
MQAREMILKGLSVEVIWSKFGHHTSARVPAVEPTVETRDPNTKTQMKQSFGGRKSASLKALRSIKQKYGEALELCTAVRMLR